MKYNLTKSSTVPKKEKHGISIDIYPDIDGAGVVHVSTETGHNQEFYDRQSTFIYFILDGSGKFFLDDEEIEVDRGDVLSIEPNTRIYYKGALKMLLLTTPAWKPENEVETRSSIW